MGAYPIKIEISDDTGVISRLRPATVCTDRARDVIATDALALERPRKKLSFRDPEISGYDMNCVTRELKVKKQKPPPLDLRRSTTTHNGGFHREDSCEDFYLEVVPSLCKIPTNASY